MDQKAGDYKRCHGKCDNFCVSPKSRDTKNKGVMIYTKPKTCSDPVVIGHDNVNDSEEIYISFFGNDSSSDDYSSNDIPCPRCRFKAEKSQSTPRKDLICRYCKRQQEQIKREQNVKSTSLNAAAFPSRDNRRAISLTNRPSYETRQQVKKWLKQVQNRLKNLLAIDTKDVGVDANNIKTRVFSEAYLGKLYDSLYSPQMRREPDVRHFLDPLDDRPGTAQTMPQTKHKSQYLVIMKIPHHEDDHTKDSDAASGDDAERSGAYSDREYGTGSKTGISAGIGSSCTTIGSIKRTYKYKTEKSDKDGKDDMEISGDKRSKVGEGTVDVENNKAKEDGALGAPGEGKEKARRDSTGGAQDLRKSRSIIGGKEGLGGKSKGKYESHGGTKRDGEKDKAISPSKGTGEAEDRRQIRSSFGKDEVSGVGKDKAKGGKDKAGKGVGRESTKSPDSATRNTKGSETRQKTTDADANLFVKSKPDKERKKDSKEKGGESIKSPDSATRKGTGSRQRTVDDGDAANLFFSSKPGKDKKKDGKEKDVKAEGGESKKTPDSTARNKKDSRSKQRIREDDVDTSSKPVKEKKTGGKDQDGKASGGHSVKSPESPIQRAAHDDVGANLFFLSKPLKETKTGGKEKEGKGAGDGADKNTRGKSPLKTSTQKAKKVKKKKPPQNIEEPLTASELNLNNLNKVLEGVAPTTTQMVKGLKITTAKLPLVKSYEIIHDVPPLLFKTSLKYKTDDSEEGPADTVSPSAVGSSPAPDKLTKISPKVKKVAQVDQDAKGITRFALSDRTFIDKGWTMLPTEKVVRKMNIYKMRPAHPEFDWFSRNKNKGFLQYDSGEKLAEFNENGRGRLFYRNGRQALDYYDCEETNAQQRFVVFSSGRADERGRRQPHTVLATFDYLGNGVVFDHKGKIRLKYNQTEGVILDRTLGPVSTWKWHSLNDPPVLQQVMIDTHLPEKDPEIMKLGMPDENKPRKDNEEMLAIEFDNFIKEKSKKLTQKFKPFQIKMKALKINENFSLRILDQASVYLIYRDGRTNVKLNLGMILDHQEIVDTDTAEVGEVANSMDRQPARTESLAGLQKSVAHAQRIERARLQRERRLRPPVPSASIDRLISATSRPMQQPILPAQSGSGDFFAASPNYSGANCQCKPLKSASNLYYDTRLI